MENKMIVPKSDIDKIQRNIFDFDRNPKLREKFFDPCVNVFQLPTGFGKTHGVWGVTFPKCRQIGTIHYNYLAPQTACIDDDKFQSILQSAGFRQGEYTYLSSISENPKKPKTLLTYENLADIRNCNDRMPIFICATHDFFKVGNKRRIMQFLFDYHRGHEVVTAGDELHYGAATTQEAARQANGACPDTYTGQLWNYIFSPLIENGFNCNLGMTATPTPEIVQEWKNGQGKDQYVIANDWVRPEEAVTQIKHLNNIRYYTNTVSEKMRVLGEVFQDRREHQAELTEAIDYYLEDDAHKENHSVYDAFGDKDGVPVAKGLRIPKIGIRCETAGGSDNITLSKVKEHLIGDRILSIERGENFITTCSEEGWKVYDANGEEVGGGKGNGWVNAFNNYDQNIALLMINQGNMACDFPALTHGVILNEPSAKNDDGFITKTTKQYLGRFSRFNAGGLTYEDMVRLPTGLQDKLWKFNTFSLYIPRIPSLIRAVEEFTADYTFKHSDLYKVKVKQ